MRLDAVRDGISHCPCSREYEEGNRLEKHGSGVGSQSKVAAKDGQARLHIAAASCNDSTYPQLQVEALQVQDLAVAQTTALQPHYKSGGNRWDNSATSPTQMQR